MNAEAPARTVAFTEAEMREWLSSTAKVYSGAAHTNRGVEWCASVQWIRLGTMYDFSVYGKNEVVALATLAAAIAALTSSPFHT